MPSCGTLLTLCQSRSRTNLAAAPAPAAASSTSIERWANTVDCCAAVYLWLLHVAIGCLNGSPKHSVPECLDGCQCRL